MQAESSKHATFILSYLRQEIGLKKKRKLLRFRGLFNTQINNRHPKEIDSKNVLRTSKIL